MADAAIFEKRGIVAAAIITSPFKLTANSMAKRYGFTDYHYAVMRHPIGNLRPEQIRAAAEEVLPQVLAILGLPEASVPA